MADTQDKQARPAGYSELAARFAVTVIPNWHESVVVKETTRRVQVIDGRVRESYPVRYWPGDSFGDHLEFALKYDGVNLEILAPVFAAAPKQEMTTYVQSKPMGKYARRAWYLYELLTGSRLPVKDLPAVAYVDLLDPDGYYTATGRAIARQRVRDNLLGDPRFCPVVRRTERLAKFEKAGLAQRCQKVIAKYPKALLKRALSYLYTKETKSSFEIERITPTATRTERFVALLELAEREDFFNKSALIGLQNKIVDERYRDSDYRRSQNYVGETVAWQRERVHYAAPKPTDLPDMMAGMEAAHRRMLEGEVHPVVHAAVTSFGFVFMHPFEDGNGRIHRFLIHNILANRGFTPRGIMFPVSAAMLRDADAYDAALEAFSKPLMALVDYSLDDQGRMTVHNETAIHYRYMDMTDQVEALFEFIQRTIDVELVEELDFLRNYDKTKAAIQEVVDMPDRRLDLFIRFCLQNNGRLSARKRTSQFAELKADEVRRMEQIVQGAYGHSPSD